MNAEPAISCLRAPGKYHTFRHHCREHAHGEGDATEEEIIEALKVACAWDFVEKMPDTIHSSVGERGRGLSEGQAQRIAIARAVLRNSPVLLLDEATSALDVATERTVLRNIVKQHPN